MLYVILRHKDNYFSDVTLISKSMRSDKTLINNELIYTETEVENIISIKSRPYYVSFKAQKKLPIYLYISRVIVSLR